MASPLIIIIILSVGWNTFHFLHHWIFSNYNSSLISSIEQNRNKSTFTMLRLTKTTFCLTSDKTYSTYYQSRKNITLIRRFTLTSNWELCLCITMLTLYLMFIGKLSKKNSIKWLNLVFLNHVGPLNKNPQLFLKRMARFDKSLIYTHSTKQTFANNTNYPSSPTS